MKGKELLDIAHAGFGIPVYNTAAGLKLAATRTQYTVPLTSDEIVALRWYDEKVDGSINWKLARDTEVWQQVNYADWGGHGVLFFSLDAEDDSPDEREKVAGIIRDHLNKCHEAWQADPTCVKVEV